MSPRIMCVQCIGGIQCIEGIPLSAFGSLQCIRGYQDACGGYYNARDMKRTKGTIKTQKN